jgi:uncharacterized protein YggE
MTDQPLLAVRGDAVVEVEPEVARLGLTVRAMDADRLKTMRLLDERMARAGAVLAGFGDAVEKVETSSVRVSPQLKTGKPRERIAGYVAVVSQTVTVTGLDRIGDLVAQLADQDLADVTGPWWDLRPDSPVRRRARVEAVHDAVRRARDYAGALGSHLTELVELADQQLLSDGRGPAAPAWTPAAPPMARQSAAPAEFTFDVSPTKQVVRASVEARFRFSAPDLSEEIRAGR